VTVAGHGTLDGLRVLEMAGLGPGPFAAMMLADAGAEVLRLDRTGGGGFALGDSKFDLLNRGKRSAAVDFKHPDGVTLVLDLVERADVLIEGFRPGVMERLGLGPDACLDRNQRLVYARVTGWGQAGPLAQTAGHDIDYIAVAGVLHPMGHRDRPPAPPLNLVGDFGGGGMVAAYGITCALLERQRSGKGQVVDAAMVDGAALLATMLHGMVAGGLWSSERGANLLDSGAPFYDVYETADGQFLAVGAIEPRFYAALLDVLELSDEELPGQLDVATWPAVSERIAAIVRTRSRAEWLVRADGRDACVAPVVPLLDAPQHPHNQARGSFTTVDGITQPAPAPRFSRTPSSVSRPPSRPGQHTATALSDWGVTEATLDKLWASGAVE
jgi:alpha-methylacyl-CoA racemase